LGRTDFRGGAAEMPQRMTIALSLEDVEASIHAEVDDDGASVRMAAKRGDRTLANGSLFIRTEWVEPFVRLLGVANVLVGQALAGAARTAGARVEGRAGEGER
jgi:hypothetical protein